MGLLEETLKGKSLADYTNTQLRLALGAVLYTNTADMWHKYLTQLGYKGSVGDMLQKYYIDYAVPKQFRNYIWAGLFLNDPRSLFAGGAQGYIYDTDDLTAMFLDAAGTTPATVNGLVGLVLDKSRGLALGSEVISQPLDLTTWQNVGTVSATTANSFTNTSGAGAGKSLIIPVGKWYRVSMTFSKSDASTIFGIYDSSSAFPLTTTTAASGTLTCTYYSAGPIYLRLGGNATVTITSISVKEIAGNHAYQSTTGFKPVLRGTPVGGNLVTNGDFATDTVWSKGTGWTIGGGVATKTAGSTQSLLQSVSVSAGRVYRFTYTITVSAGGVQPLFSGGTSSFGALRSVSGTYVEYITANSGNNIAGFTVNATFAGTVDNIIIDDVSADSVTAPYGLQFDGADDFLQTASVDFSATDKMTVCAGVRKLSDAAIGALLEFSASKNLNTGVFAMFAPINPPSGEFVWYSKGTLERDAATTAYPAPVTSVLTGTGDISGDVSQLRVNGAVVQTNTADQGTGNYGNYVLYFGRRGGTSLPFNGIEYSSICVGRAVTASELANIERWVAQRTGVSL